MSVSWTGVGIWDNSNTTPVQGRPKWLAMGRAQTWWGCRIAWADCWDVQVEGCVMGSLGHLLSINVTMLSVAGFPAVLSVTQGYWSHMLSSLGTTCLNLGLSLWEGRWNSPMPCLSLAAASMSSRDTGWKYLIPADNNQSLQICDPGPGSGDSYCSCEHRSHKGGFYCWP